MNQDDLADRARVGRGTISALESDAREVLPNNRDAVVAALEKAGVTFETTAETLTIIFQRAAVERPPVVEDGP